MASPYRRRRPAILHRLWVYRNLVLAAVVLGVILWFILINRADVTVVFPFGVGQISSRLGIVILLSALAGSLCTALAGGVLLAVRHFRGGPGRPDGGGPDPLADDRPPSDYAAKTTEGFSDPRWTDKR